MKNLLIILFLLPVIAWGQVNRPNQTADRVILDSTAAIASDGAVYYDGSNFYGYTDGASVRLDSLGGGGSSFTYLTESNDSLLFTGHAKFDSTAQFVDDISVASLKKIYIDGGGDTYLYESSANNMSAVVGGTTIMQIATGSVVMYKLLSANTNLNLSSSVLYSTSTGTIADNDATPAVNESNIYTYAGSANSVTITDLDNPVVGAIYTIIGNSDTYTITISDGGNFNLGAASRVLGLDDVLVLFVQADNDYIEINYADN